jgi:hypothetical protein
VSDIFSLFSSVLIYAIVLLVSELGVLKNNAKAGRPPSSRPSSASGARKVVDIIGAPKVALARDDRSLEFSSGSRTVPPPHPPDSETHSHQKSIIQNVLIKFDEIFSKDQNEVPAVAFVYFLKSYVSTLCADQVQQVIQNNKLDTEVSNMPLAGTGIVGSQLDVIMSILKSGMHSRATGEGTSSESLYTSIDKAVAYRFLTRYMLASDVTHHQTTPKQLSTAVFCVPQLNIGSMRGSNMDEEIEACLRSHAVTPRARIDDFEKLLGSIDESIIAISALCDANYADISYLYADRLTLCLY